MEFFKNWRSADSCQLLPTLDAEQTARYRRFRRLLEHNRTALSLQADLEQIYYDNRPFMPQMVEHRSNQLLLEVDGMVNALSGMTKQDYEPLFAVLRSIGRSVQDEWSGIYRERTEALALPLNEVTLEQIDQVGAKAANLAHVGGELGLTTPIGFAMTTTACRRFLQTTGLVDTIDTMLAELIDDDPYVLERVSRAIIEYISAAPLPSSVAKALEAAAAEFAPDQLFAVRSSAIGEDGDVSFAGQYTSLLQVPAAGLPDAYRQVVASLYSAPALSYRMHHGLDDRETPMAVLVLPMIKAQASGVLYTADPAGSDDDSIRISAVAGTGERLVGGEAAPEQSVRIDKNTLEPADDNPAPAQLVPPSVVQELAGAAQRMEAWYRRPLDIEWAVDETGRLFILQVRPLLILPDEDESDEETRVDFPGHPLLLEGGKCAAGGVATGRVLVTTAISVDAQEAPIEPDTILVVRTASTTYTPWMSKVKGLITDVGGTASHLASVAREFGVPALFGTGDATTTLKDGEVVTLWASHERVYQGAVEELIKGVRQIKRPIFNSPAHLRLQRLLDLISPLNLTDPDAPEFTPEGCRTLHDIIRFCHEWSVRHMFNLVESIGHTQNAVRLKATIPITLFALDLGGGLRPGLTTCDEVNAHDVVSTPFAALWQGFTYPGVNWTSGVAVGARDFMSLLGAGARPHDNTALGGASYAILSADYVNLSVRFGYHFATVDALCGDDVDHNYVTLSYAGGAGAYHGRSLRIQFLATVLSRLGFTTEIKGDMLDASLMRLDKPALSDALDQLGRLLGASRLLDMALKTSEQVISFTEAFFAGTYDFLEAERSDALSDFYLITGDWRMSEREGEAGLLQDGSQVVSSLSAGFTQTMTRILGTRYQEFLDNIEAYCYFPLIIAKDSMVADGSAAVRVKPLAGIIDQAGGLAFAIRDWANYYVFRINALEGNAILFEFRNGKRFERQRTAVAVRAGSWHRLRVDIAGADVRAFVDDVPVCEHRAERAFDGYLGLWAKADSVTLFDQLSWNANDGSSRRWQQNVREREGVGA